MISEPDETEKDFVEKGLDALASLSTAVAPELLRPDDKSKTADTSSALIFQSPFKSDVNFCLFVGEPFRPDEISKIPETSRAFIIESDWLSVNL